MLVIQPFIYPFVSHPPITRHHIHYHGKKGLLDGFSDPCPDRCTRGVPGSFPDPFPDRFILGIPDHFPDPPPDRFTLGIPDHFPDSSPDGITHGVRAWVLLFLLP
jgi:hypothetical protein